MLKFPTSPKVLFIYFLTEKDFPDTCSNFRPANQNAYQATHNQSKFVWCCNLFIYSQLNTPCFRSVEEPSTPSKIESLQSRLRSAPKDGLAYISSPRTNRGHSRPLPGQDAERDMSRHHSDKSPNAVAPDVIYFWFAEFSWGKVFFRWKILNSSSEVFRRQDLQNVLRSIARPIWFVGL